MTDRNIKIGIVGTNFISDDFVKAVKENQGIEVTSVYSRKEETGVSFAEKHGIENVFCDYEKMLKSDIDAVYIASPTFMHYTHAKVAIEYGKHILCEKMITLTKEQFLKLREQQSRTRVVLMQAMRPDFDPAYNIIKEKMNLLGEIRHINFSYCQYSRRYDKFKSGEVLNAFNAEIGNSALADIGIYPLQTCVNFFGLPNEVLSKSYFLNNGFEASGSAVLSYPNMTAEISYSKITEGVNPSFIEGENGSITFERISTPKNIVLHLRGKEAEKIESDYQENNMKYEVASFVNSIKGNFDYEKYLDITEKTLSVVEEIYRQNGIKNHFMKELLSV